MKKYARKSLYVFLSALLGALLFLILHRLAMFTYFFLLDTDYNSFSFGMTPLEILALDYFTLILVLMMGFWYGIWVGLHWYDLVYEQQTHGGFLKYINSKIWNNAKRSTQSSQILEVARSVENEMWQLEDLVEGLPEEKLAVEESSAVPVKRRVSRTRTIKSTKQE